MGLKKLTKYEELIANDPKRITKYNVFYSNMSYAKLRKNNIHISPSISYHRPQNKIYVGGEKVRKLTKDD